LLGLAAIHVAAKPSRPGQLEIVDRSIAYHGFDRLPELEVDLVVSSKSGSFQVTALPGDVFDYRVRTNDGGKELFYRHANVDGEQLEVLEDGVAKALADETMKQRARDFVSARIYFLFLPYRLNDPGTYKQDLGLEEWDGRRLHKVRLTFEPEGSTYGSEAYLFWFDPETARLEQFAYSFPDGLRFRKLVNYREIGGLLLFDQENYAVDDTEDGVDWITSATAPTMKHLSTIALTEVLVRERQGEAP
jgi:hypothetical protein